MLSLQITNANSLAPDRHDNLSGRSGSKLFSTLMAFLKEFLIKVDFEKNQQTTKKHAKFPIRQRVNTYQPPLNPHVKIIIRRTRGQLFGPSSSTSIF